MNKNNLGKMLGASLALSVASTPANATLIDSIEALGDAGGVYNAQMFDDRIEFSLSSQYFFDNFLTPMGSSENVDKTSISVNELDECATSGSYFGCTGYNNFTDTLTGSIFLNDTSKYTFSGFDLNTRDSLFTFSSQPTQFEQYFPSFNPIIGAKKQSPTTPNPKPQIDASTPGTTALLGLGLAGLAYTRRKKQ